ncbi:hypothetical protein VNO78_30473 [Psophocarpus tetragonolobus]|uniref:Uncharacterized protein n=1 Tax=Psophocarpus tetragonolobus TaxID=3891 RepID=A0AAN9RWZ3_PSOTE
MALSPSFPCVIVTPFILQCLRHHTASFHFPLSFRSLLPPRCASPSHSPLSFLSRLALPRDSSSQRLRFASSNCRFLDSPSSRAFFRHSLSQGFNFAAVKRLL